MTAPDLTPEQKFWGRIQKSEDCWGFVGARTSDGYGSLGFRGRFYRAHRLAYELAHGPIPDGLVVMHICDNPPCCRPDHLRVGTVAENNRDRHEKGRDGVLPTEKQRAFKPHGTRSRYRAGCRCDDCREAENSRQRAETAQRRAERGLEPYMREADHPHGTRSRYRAGCRCDGCRRSESERRGYTWRG